MSSRIERLRKRFDALYIDAMLITEPTNIFYLTGFTLVPGDGALLVTKDAAVLITDDRYATELEQFDSDEVVAMITRDYWHDLNKLCTGMQIEVLGFENTLNYRIYDLLDEIMNADIVPFDGMIEEMRSIKDADEVTKLRQAAKLHVKGYEYVLDFIKSGMTERQVANRLDFWMKEHGASGAAFPTICASGANAAMPHVTATDKVITDGDIVTLDFGYFVNGYTADMTRTFAVGSIDPELKDVYQIVNEARQAVIDKAKVGIHGDALDAAGRQIIDLAGYGDEFNHGMGHGIGLSVHELPATYGPESHDVVLQNNQIITVEPGIYIPEIGGVRIEDDILVTHGGIEVLTTAPTKLQIVRN